MTWSTVADHADTAVSRTLSQYHDKPRFIALVRALAAGVQALEDEVDDLVTLRTLANATGAALDQYGSIVGEQRGDFGDADYRAFISARIAANKSMGDPDTLSRILATLTGADLVAGVEHTEYPPASVIYTVAHTLALSVTFRGRALRVIADAKPAGVAVEVVETRQTGFEFRFDTVDQGFDAGQFSRTFRA